MTAGNLFQLYVGNSLLFLATLGLAYPWLMVRSRRYDCVHLTLEGVLNLESIRQDTHLTTATGEELGGLLDVDALPG